MKNKVLHFIRLVTGDPIPEPDDIIDREDCSHCIITEIFEKGACGRFALLLKFVFPTAEFYHSVECNHVITKIDDIFYDVFGVYSEVEPAESLNFKKVNEEFLYDHELVDNYSFKERGPIV